MIAGAVVAGEGADLVALPGNLPPGERVLWQGRPDWTILARRAFHLRGLAGYFAMLLCWYAVSAFSSGETAAQTALNTARMCGVALVPLALMCAFAWLTARSALYTITDRRLVFSVGVALPMSINLPFARIASAGVEHLPGGYGNIALELVPDDKLALLAVWPHARPWRMARPEPMLRCIPDVANVAQMLARALAVSAGMQVQASHAGSAGAAVAQPQISALA